MPNMNPIPDAAKLLERMREVDATASQIQGWLHPEAGSTLYQIARLRAPVPNVVELGSWKGRSTVWLAAAVADRGQGRVWAVDTWAGSHEPLHAQLLSGYAEGQLHAEFLANLARFGLAEHVEAVVADTLEASHRWPLGRGVGLLYIDASHEYAAVRRDFEFWSPFVCDGGYVVFDDVPGWPGPTRLVSELPRWFRQAGVSPGQWIVRRATR